MKRCLVVAGTEQGQLLLQKLLLQQMQLERTQMDILPAANGLEARKLLQLHAFDLVVVSAPLADEYGDAVARAADAADATTLLLVKAEHADPVWEHIKQTDVCLLTKPFKRAMLFQALRHATKLTSLRRERDRLRQQIQEANLLNRAKLVLIQVLKMTEPQAHRYIEKQAMDLRITRREVAEGIINTYEN